MNFAISMPQLPHFIQDLHRQLEHPLPGAVAQYRMAPKGRKSHVKQSFNQQFHKKAAVLILLYEENGVWHFPLIQRPTYDGTHSAQVGLPGGKIEAHDTDLSDTALRETEEELGVAQNDITLLSALTPLYIPPSNFLVSPYVGFTPPPVFVPDAFEVAEILPTSLFSLMDYDNQCFGKIKLSNGLHISSPYYDLHDRMVWGATAMILSEFAHCLQTMGFAAR